MTEDLHDDKCEAEPVAGTQYWTDCGCADRSSLTDRIFADLRTDWINRYGTPHNDTTRRQALQVAYDVIDAVRFERWHGGQVYKVVSPDHHGYLAAIKRLLEE